MMEAKHAALADKPGHRSGREQTKIKRDQPPPEPDGKKKGATSKGGKAVASRPCKEHSFLTDVADVRAMEQGLLQLLDDFHSGKLQAFGGDTNCEKMDQIREQQEKLARLHFDLDLQQDMHRIDTEEARTATNDNLSKLIEQLQGLSTSIQTLNSVPPPDAQSKCPKFGQV